MKLLLWIRSTPFFLRLTWFTRILLAAGFIPTGMVKLLGQRFTLMSVDTPIGAFFEAMYQTGLYWNFLGAVLFLPIVANVFVITISLGFRGTPWITGMMLLAVLYLCLWDYPRFWSVFRERPLGVERTPPNLRLDRMERIGFQLFAASLLTFFLLTRGFTPGGLGIPTLVVGLAAGLFTLVRFVTSGRRMRVANPGS